MSDKLLPLSHCLIAQRPNDAPVAYHAGHYYSAGQFANTVSYWVDKLQAQPFQHYALYTEDAYPFAVLLFALLHAGKQIRIPGNNRPGTAEQLSPDCQLLGDWQTGECFDYCLEASASSSRSLSPLNPSESQLVIFTSGSTGQAKPIAKCLNQFQLEIATLEKHWGEQLGDAAALATVSHQHIYGLLFRVLWPLSAGRCFHSQAYINPETLVNAIQHESAYWIASPAHLKRLDQASPWEGIAKLKAIFSSGGALPEQAAEQILNDGKQAVVEIYGSSETGGIAWRRQSMTAAWTLFSGMRLSCIDGKWFLHSPYLEIPPSPPFSKGGDEESSSFTAEESSFSPRKHLSPLEKGGAGGIQLDDQIILLDDGRFMLHGRSDRIVKIEEKRLSLVELEQRLMSEPWIDDAHALVITHHRDVVAAIVVLSSQGLEQEAIQGRNRLIRQLRKALEQWFEAVVLPRKWLFVNTMPLTSQGKINQPLLKSLLDFDNRKLPQALTLELTPEGVRLGLKVPEDLLYFPDHFPSYPILPGVVQLAWVEHFGKLFFVIDKPFSQLEVVKFTQVIQPGDELTLALDWKAASGKLYFNFSSERGMHSSGRMVYEGKE
ncbi:AMP-binding protein [Methylobacter tundripaludum]|uniref:AMP-dependent synthetase and ligase n=1 Tax=Methylobacter tundripaludum (strain ATCC BAA-1195 / DSM 17260 / SV96) TaxID=697282 RepID=G3IYZ9_METTV|nr:AMP-binding protein [Methylobacter tundripaludum]EGW20171.1 AMP-dependent synthetase and ligase [Methylobacter tundripaludum SV96]